MLPVQRPDCSAWEVKSHTVMDVGATQLVGSQSQQPILLKQPPFEVIGKQVFRRPGRGQETECLIRFIGCVSGKDYAMYHVLLGIKQAKTHSNPQAYTEDAPYQINRTGHRL